MSSLSEAIALARSEGRKATGLFVTAGFPDADSTDAVLDALVAGGADFIELGMPFSDPLAEGPPIQRSSERALRHGATMSATLDTALRFRSRHATPLVLMGYYNPVLQYGLGNFCTDARSSGVDGLIIPDLPPEEAKPLADAAAANGLDMIFLIAPNTSDERVAAIDELSSGFVYAVSVTGVTGGQLSNFESTEAYLSRVSAVVKKNAVLVGFGIRSHEDAVRLTKHTDGFIVGSALVSLVEELWDAPMSVSERSSAIAKMVADLRVGH
ncbi:MAG: tryptophan synthase subunit alpha [Rhodothermales bacterium]